MPSEAKDYLLAEIKKRLDRCKEITADADKGMRELTDEETAEIKANMTRVEEHKVEVKRIEDRESLNKQLEDLGTVTHEATTNESVEIKARTIGEAFIRSPEYQALCKSAVEGGLPDFRMPTIEMKAAGDPVLESTSNNGDAIAPMWDNTLRAPGLLQYPLRIADVMNIVQVTQGNSVNYPVVTQRDAAPALTVESQQKPGAEFAFDFETNTLVKHAQFGGASEEMFQDAPVIANYITNELGTIVLQAEEAYIAAGLYTASTTAADGSGITTGENGYDAVLEAMTMVRVAGGVPSVILLHPNDWARLATLRAVAGDGSYFSGGPYAAPRQGLWGSVREVQTTSVPEGTALVGDFNRGATLYRKGGLRTDASFGYLDYFRRNLIAIRSEIRSVLGVHYPEFFVEVEVGS